MGAFISRNNSDANTYRIYQSVSDPANCRLKYNKTTNSYYNIFNSGIMSLVAEDPTHLHNYNSHGFIGYQIKDEITNKINFIKCSECYECIKELDNIKNNIRYSDKKNRL